MQTSKDTAVEREAVEELYVISSLLRMIFKGIDSASRDLVLAAPSYRGLRSGSLARPVATNLQDSPTRRECLGYNWRCKTNDVAWAVKSSLTMMLNGL